ncbi:MAG: phytanoyl-CoA dioxygenase family protein [Chloroflexi bacterium]|nr:phytanoyl-CoA dioxygenase family protein [Chloroflexota bacterium]
MLTPEQVRAYHDQGFVAMTEPLLTGAEVERLRQALDEVIRGESPGRPVLLRNLAGGDLHSDAVVIQIVNIWQAHAAFAEHVSRPDLVELVAQLCPTDTLRVWHDQIQYKPPTVGTATRWHQDFPAWPVLTPPDQCTAWVALDDVTVANGCLRFVPGSHRWGAHQGLGTNDDFSPRYDPAQLPPDARVRVSLVEVPRGGISFHHAMTWHGSAPNPTPAHRRAIAVHYMPGHTRYVAAGRHVMSPYITVGNGDVIAGDAFPVVWQRTA